MTADKNATIDEKLDTLLVSTTKLTERQDTMLSRMGAVEKKAEKLEKFVDNCALGRRVALWALSSLGAIATLAIAAYAALIKP